MFVLDLTASVVIERPIETVLAYMDDIEREAEWQPYLREWSPSPDPDIMEREPRDGMSTRLWAGGW